MCAAEALDLAGNILSPIELTLSLIKHVYNAAQTAKANKDRCQLIAKRVKALEEVVLSIRQQGLVAGCISSTTENALKELCTTLVAAKNLMVKHSRDGTVMGLWRAGSNGEKINEINDRLNHSSQVLSMALQIEQGNVLQRVFQTVSGNKQVGFEHCGEHASSKAAIPAIPAMPMPMPMPTPQIPMPPVTKMPPMPMPMPMPMPQAPMSPVTLMPPMPHSFLPAPTPVLATLIPNTIVSSAVPRPIAAPIAEVRYYTPNTSTVNYVVNRPRYL